MVNTTDDYSS